MLKFLMTTCTSFVDECINHKPAMAKMRRSIRILEVHGSVYELLGESFRESVVE